MMPYLITGTINKTLTYYPQKDKNGNYNWNGLKNNSVIFSDREYAKQVAAKMQHTSPIKVIDVVEVKMEK